MEKRVIITVLPNDKLDIEYKNVTFLEMLGVAEYLNFYCKLEMNDQRNRHMLIAKQNEHVGAKKIHVKKTKKK